MSEIKDDLNEAVERARESKLNTMIAAAVALIATFMSLCSVKAGNIVQQMSQAQANAVDQWAYYQSKGTKENIAEAAVDQFELQREMTTSITPEQKQKLDAAVQKQKDATKRYAREKEDIKRKAGGFEKEREVLDVRNDQFDVAEAMMSVAIALFGVTALTQKRFMFFVAGTFGGFGMFMGIAGFAKLAFHPEWLASFLT